MGSTSPYDNDMRRRRNLDTRRARTLDGYRNERVALGSIVAESPRHEELPDAEVLELDPRCASEISGQ